MGLFDWLKPKTRTHGPTPEGLYGELPKGEHWGLGPDPAGAPEEFVPGSNAYVFDISELRWDKHLWIDATADSAGTLAGFSLLFGLSDGTNTDAVEVWDQKPGRGPVLKARQEWTIPRGHPTRELALISRGEQTTQILRNVEQCFGEKPTALPALPENTAIISELLMVRGLVIPDEGRFTARTKVVFTGADGGPYGEFFLHINSVRKQIWLSEKSTAYRDTILIRLAHQETGA